MKRTLRLQTNSIHFRLAALLFFHLVGFAMTEAQTTGPSMTPAAADAVAIVKKADPVKITFDEKDPTIMIVESNGERFRVNSVTKQIERIESSETPSTPTVAATESPAQDRIDYYAYDSGDEPFDYRLVNVPTPKKVPKGTWNMTFTHRFSQPLQPLGESAPGLLGFDSMSSSSFGITYGITDKLYVNAYRSPLCLNGMCRTIEVGFGYHITDQEKLTPIAASVYASVEGNYNFTEHVP